MKKFYLLIGIFLLLSTMSYSQVDFETRRSDNWNTKSNEELKKARKSFNIAIDRIPSASAVKGVASNGAKASVSFISYDFTDGMPSTFELIDGDCGWLVGSSGSSSYFNIPSHDGNYAYVNDDACGSGMDMADVWMKLPAVDLTGITMPFLQFDNYRERSNDIFTIKVSVDGTNWTDVVTYTTELTAWQTETIDLSTYAGQSTVYIAFHYNDEGGWNYGWAVDNIIIGYPNEHDFAAVSIAPSYVFEGSTVSPKVVIENVGATAEALWSVVLTDGGSYTSTVNGTQSIAPGENYTVTMDDWTPAATSTLTATVTLAGDGDNTDNVITKSVTVGTYVENATYAGNAINNEYGTLNLTNGTFTSIGEYSTTPFPSGEEYDGNYIYRVLSDFSIGIVYPNGDFEKLGTLSGVEGSVTGIAYDWQNDVMYANLMYTSDGGTTYYGRLCTINMDDFTLTLVGQGSIAVFMRGLDFASDGFLYGPSLMSQQLIKIDPATGENSVVGNIGLTLGYAQDVSYDGIEQKLYSITCSSTEARFGYYDLVTGAFNTIHNYGSNQFPTIVVTKIPQPTYAVTFNVTDGTEGLDEAVITIGERELTTNVDGTVSASFIDGTYNYSVEKFGFEPYSGSFTVNGAIQNVNITLTALSTYNVTFNIKNNLNAPLNANIVVYIDAENEFESGTATDGTITFNNVPVGNYTYDVTYESYVAKTGEALVVDDNEAVNVVLLENIGADPFNLEVAVDGRTALFSWNNVYGLDSFEDSFEDGTFNAWEELIQGPGEVGDDGGNPYWYVTDPSTFSTPAQDGSKVAFINWGYNINTWLISPQIAITSSTILNFYFRTSYYWHVSPNPNGDLFVKVSTDGGDNWTQIWREEDYGEFENFEWVNVNLDLSAYAGQSINIAFNMVASDNSTMEIDAVNVSSAKGSKSLQNYEVFLNGSSMGTTNQLNYTFSDLEPGTYVAGVRAVYETGSTATSTESFVINEVGVPILTANDMSIYPNPSNGLVNIEAPENSVVKIMDVAGKLIETFNINERARFDFNQTAGIYFITIENNSTVSTHKIIVK